MQGVNVAGYHLHFITQDKKQEGIYLIVNYKMSELKFITRRNLRWYCPIVTSFVKQIWGWKTPEVEQVEDSRHCQPS